MQNCPVRSERSRDPGRSRRARFGVAETRPSSVLRDHVVEVGKWGDSPDLWVGEAVVHGSDGDRGASQVPFGDEGGDVPFRRTEGDGT